MNSTEYENINGSLCARAANNLNSNNVVRVEQEGCDVYNGTLSGDQAVTLTAASGQTNISGPKVLEKYSYGLDHVMLSGGTTYQGRGYYDEQCGCLKTQAHGVGGGDECE